MSFMIIALISSILVYTYIIIIEIYRYLKKKKLKNENFLENNEK